MAALHHALNQRVGVLLQVHGDIRQGHQRQEGSYLVGRRRSSERGYDRAALRGLGVNPGDAARTRDDELHA